MNASIVFKAKPAPCSGLLVNPYEAGKALQAMEVDLPAAQKELGEQKKFFLSQLSQAESRTEAAIRATEQLQDLITQKVDPPTVWESPWFWGGTMFVVGLVGGGVAVWAIMK